MIKGLMRQAVHPMDDSLANSGRQPTITSALHSQGDDDGADGGGGGLKLKLNAPSEHSGDLRPGKPPGMTAQAGDAESSPGGGSAVVKPGLLVSGSHRKVNGTTGGGEAGGVLDDELDEQPTTTTSPAGDDPPPWNRAKTGRQLTFADETGEALAEINYSNRTHYSKQPPPGAAAGPARACCVIQ